MLLRVWAAKVSHSWAFSSVMAAFVPVLEHSLSSGWNMRQVSCRKPFTQHFSFNLPYNPASRASKCPCTSHEQSAGFSQPCWKSHWPFDPTRGFIFPLLYPRIGSSIHGSNYSFIREILRLCNLPLPLGPLRGIQLPNQLLLFPTIVSVSFLQPWLYQNLSASLQFIFSENCSTCWCMFDVFWWVRWVPCPLHCHLVLSSFLLFWKHLHVPISK